MFKKINMWILMGKKVIVVRKNEKITLCWLFWLFHAISNKRLGG